MGDTRWHNLKKIFRRKSLKLYNSSGAGDLSIFNLHEPERVQVS